jgi:hypothetical protein
VFLKVLFWGPCFSNLLTNDVCDAIGYSVSVCLAYGIIIYSSIKYPGDCNMLEADVSFLRGSCTAGHMKLASIKLKIYPSQGKPIY